MKSTGITFSVIMSVYNGDDVDYFNEAMRSIWDEQILKPNYIILVRDGFVSKKMEEAIVNWELKLKTKIKVVRSKYNVGLAISLNKAISVCDTDYVARMDADDVSLPDRFNQQVEFLKRNPKVDILGGNIVETDFDTFEKNISYPIESEKISKLSKIRSPHAHVTVFMKREALLSIGCYPTYYPEDYPLWAIVQVNNLICKNIDSTLVKVRMNDGMLSRRGKDFFLGILEAILFQKRIGHINVFQMFFNIVYRFIVHCMPMPIRKLIYKFR